MRKKIVGSIFIICCSIALIGCNASVESKREFEQNEYEQVEKIEESNQQSHQQETSITDKENTTTVMINDHTFFVELAQTEEEHFQGLSGHSPLEENKGMLFLFEDTTIRSFWMKDMIFPIDILWIHDTTIIDIEHNVPIPKEGQSDMTLPKYFPSKPVNKVLELKAGTANNSNIHIGDTITIQQ